MPLPLSAKEVLDREFLDVRCKILDLAAALDRLERAAGSVNDDPRVRRLQDALSIVLNQHANRAEQVQMIFSREYDDGWQEAMKVKRG